MDKKSSIKEDSDQADESQPDFREEFYEKISEGGRKGGEAVEDKMYREDFVPGYRGEDLGDEDLDESDTTIGETSFGRDDERDGDVEETS